MKKKLPISKMIASAALAVAAIAPSFGQVIVGGACGCPKLASRPTVELSSLADFTAISGTYGGELTNGAVLTCDKTYIIDKKIYIPAGKTLTIAPGTVLKGRIAPDGTTPGVPDPAKASALIIERGGKIIANGTADCQIVFTAEADTLDGKYPISNIGKWGGLVILGKATNNLTLAANGPFEAKGTNKKLCVQNGLGTIEGFATSNTQNYFGANLTAGESFDDNDNSGILRYVSVRHAGAILEIGSELNGITLGSVGRGTTLENLEVVSCADDNIELFGGTVNLKYVSTLFGNDDMFDYDLGWSGKAQFLFGMKANTNTSIDSDNGFEADSDDDKSNNTPKSTPVFYNVTLIGNSKTVKTSDNTGMFAIAAKEATGGEFYNSVFANFMNGFNTVKSLGTRATGSNESYHYWSTANGLGTTILKVKCNTFVGVTNPLTVGGVASGAVQADIDQFAADGNLSVTSLPGFDYSFTIDPATNAITVKNDVSPNPALSISGCPTAPMDGFFKYANYRGAFSSNLNENWLSNWSYSQVLGATKGIVACPTDINADGVTNVSDFLRLVNEFGKNCN